MGIEEERLQEIERLKREFEVTAAMFALSNGHYDIVEWLEKRGARKHREMFENKRRENIKSDETLNSMAAIPAMDEEFARAYIDTYNKYWPQDGRDRIFSSNP